MMRRLIATCLGLALMAPLPALAFPSQQNEYVALCATQGRTVMECDCYVDRLKEEIGFQDTERLMLIVVRRHDFQRHLDHSIVDRSPEAMAERRADFEAGVKRESGLDDAGILRLTEELRAAQDAGITLDSCAR
jgi:hypothetical protein